jgi:peptidoglycan/LPS O-acetylase OafA/YrhL
VNHFRLGTRPALDGLRAVAIGLVVVLHYSFTVPQLRPYFRGGFIGVEVFFVLSGFLITSLVISEVADSGGFNARAFYRRRSFRLIPALYVMVPICVVIGLLFHVKAFGPHDQQVIPGIASLTYVLNLFTGALPNPLPIWAQPLWSLCVEVHFYLVWPVLLVLCARRWPQRLPWLAAGTIAFSVACRVLLFETIGSPYQNLLTPARLDGLALGGLVAISLHRGWKPPASIKYAGIVGLGVLFVLTNVARPKSAVMAYVGYTVVNVLTAAILLAALDETSPLGRVLALRPLRIVGEWSYALYLWHIPVMAVVATNISQRSVRVPVAVVASLAVAGVSSNFIEKPLRRLGRSPAKRPSVVV